MGLYFSFPFGWWPVLLMVYVPYLLIFTVRKSYKRKHEVRNQFVIAIFVLAIAFLIEYVAITLGLWRYFPGNWPLPLWLGYFGAGFLGFQLLKILEEML